MNTNLDFIKAGRKAHYVHQYFLDLHLLYLWIEASRIAGARDVIEGQISVIEDIIKQWKSLDD